MDHIINLRNLSNGLINLIFFLNFPVGSSNQVKVSHLRLTFQQIRKAKAWSSEKLTPIKITREKNSPCWSSSSDNKIYDDKSENDKRLTRLNSIAELLEHFRKEDSSHKDDMKSISSSPTLPARTGSLSSSSVISDKLDSQTTVSPVDHWLSELPSLYESECSVMLQSKSLQGNFEIDERTFLFILFFVNVTPFCFAGLNKLSAYKPQVYQDIKIIQDNAREVTKSFAELCRWDWLGAQLSLH